MSETPETIDNPAAPVEESQAAEPVEGDGGELVTTPEAGDDADEGHDETGQDNAGAAPQADLPEGAEDETFDGSDVGEEGEDPGTALPDDPHGLAPEGE